MGADIHMVLERRSDRFGWVGVNAFPYVKLSVLGDGRFVEGHTSWRPTNRNYALFAALASVRGAGRKPLGVPEDASPLAIEEIEGWGEDGHSHSWMMMPEFLGVYGTHVMGGAAKLVTDNISRDELFAEWFQYFYGYLNDGQTLDDFRLVFWFDN